MNPKTIDRTAAVLFGVKEYVPALMSYIERYHAKLHFQHTLTRIDGPARKAWFTKVDTEGKKSEVETSFDMIHVVPPQVAPDFVRVSPLADQAGWVDVDQGTLRHKTFRGSTGWATSAMRPTPKSLRRRASRRRSSPTIF